jgi:BNR/Asp-box repeat
MSRRLGIAVAAATVVAAVLLAGCGGSRSWTLSELTSATTAAGASASMTTSVSSITAATTTTTGPAPTTTAAEDSATSAPSASWVPATGNLSGMPSECGNISLVSARPDQDTVIASVALHGLWSTSGRTDSWTALGQGGGAAIGNRGSTMVYDPMHADTFWESGIYNGGGVYRTDNNGVTFRQLGDIAHVDAVSVDVSDPERRTLVAGLHEQTAVLRSHDGGQTWTKISTSLPPDAGFTMSPLVVDSHTFLVGTNKAKSSGVFRTTDDGTTWTQVFQGAVAGQPLRTNDGILYWVVDGSGGVIKSTDAGATWTAAARAGTVEPLAPSLIELPGGAIAAVGKMTIIVSKDGGQTWAQIGPTMPYRPVGMTFSPAAQAFYIWYFSCDPNGGNAVPADAIMRFDVTAR